MGQENLMHMMPYICCCTAYAEDVFKRAAYDAGMDNFVTKPLDGDDLDNILRLAKLEY